jgi:magnesium-transporting ATPase (P-type)
VLPRVVHTSSGRLRVQLPGWSGRGERALEAQIGRWRGVLSVAASALTGNVLILFDPVLTDTRALLDALAKIRQDLASPAARAKRRRLRFFTEGNGQERRARIAVRGLDRDPGLAGRLVRLLQRRHGVRARSKPLTGHLLVEYTHHHALLEEILAEIAHMELPELPGEDRPAHPLDPAPFRESLIRAVGCLLGLGVLTYRRLANPVTAAASHGPAGIVASTFNLLQGFPFIRHRLRRLLGHPGADLLGNGLGILSLTLANYPLGLIVTGVEAIFLIGEVTARRAAWVRYERSLDGAAPAEPGSVIRLEAGAHVPRAARIIEGTGTATGVSALPMHLAPGGTVPAGAALAGGPFMLELLGGESFEPQPRPVPPPLSFFQEYLRISRFVSIAFAALAAARTGSVVRTFEAMLLLNPRTAVIALEAANLAAAARALRGGITVVGTRPERNIELPHVLLLDGPRLLTEGLEIAGVLPPSAALVPAEVLEAAAIVNNAAGSPWGNVFPKTRAAVVSGGMFNGLWASATVDGERYTLGPPEDVSVVPDDFLFEHQGGYILELRHAVEDTSLGLIAIRPKLNAGTSRLVEVCRQHGVVVELLPRGTALATWNIARLAGVGIAADEDAVAVIRRKQSQGFVVGFASDHAEAAPAFAAADLAIGVAGARHGEFPARADMLAPDLRAVADLVAVGARREQAVRDGVHLSAVTTGAGALLTLFAGPLGGEGASFNVYAAALAALGAVWLRMRGGHRPESSLAHLVDPRPERWGRRSAQEVLRDLHATADGLCSAEAANRRRAPTTLTGSDAFLAALRNQLRTPITGIMTGGACLALALNQPLNTALLALTTSLNILAGIWQEREVGKATEALKRMSAGVARVLRDGAPVTVSSTDLVPGDILLLGPGARVAADARMLSAAGLEVDEAALTGESLPVTKGPEEFTDAGRIILEGSDVVVGTGRAVVVAVGRHTRLGATAAALSVDRTEESAMGVRLGRILQIALPLAAAGGVLAAVSGLAYGGPVTGMLTVGLTTALAAIPEGLPLLAGVGQAGVAKRLAKRRALVRRIAAVEALGRVDVACTDKTGTMTEGRLALRLVADMTDDTYFPGPLSAELRDVLLAGALASPHPDAPDAATHPTDRAVVRGAMAAGLVEEVRALRLLEVPFDSARAFHAAVVPGRLCAKGAPERIAARCTRMRTPDGDVPLDDKRRGVLLARGVSFAVLGLRVLLVAEGAMDIDPDNPQGLTALGFVAISDPLRPSVPPAVRRCQAAGIRVMMLTGDHPATATAIALEAGLLGPGRGTVVRAAELAELSCEELDRRLDGVAVIARATPLDKLRIVESLRRSGHIVAMTGDGVNDAPSLRLADVGVAMGRGGTEVARQAADVVLTDDDFATLVEALVEGRGFWRNMRNALGLLLGGNAGELGLIVGTSLMGFGPALNTVQILLVNLITDVLPSLAVVLQQPPQRDLTLLAREGLSALDMGLRRDVLRRGLATCLPSLGAYLFMQTSGGGPAQASAVAFTGVVAVQLAQTLDAGRVQGLLSRSVVNAVAASMGLLVGTVALPPVRDALGLITPSPLGWGVIGISSVAAVAISRLISLVEAPLPLTGSPPGGWRTLLAKELRPFLAGPGINPAPSA